MAQRTKRPAARDGSVAVLGKAVALLDLLAACREATAAELAELMDEPRSSIYRLLTSLNRLGLVEAGLRGNTHRLGLKLLQLGSAVVDRLDVRLAALPAMEEVHDETDQTLLLWLRRDRKAVCIERLEGRQVAAVTIRVGDSLALHLGAGPRALLAFDRRSDWDSYLELEDLQPMLDGAKITPAALILSLDETRRRGFAISDEDVFTGFAALGVPVFDHRGKVCAAISVSGVRSKILGDDHLGERMLAAGAEVSRSLGFTSTASL